MSQRLEFFVHEMPLGCIIWDESFAVLDWNREAQNIFGWSYHQAFRQPYEELLLPEAERSGGRNLRERLLATKSTLTDRAVNVTQRGLMIECEWFHTSLVGAGGEVIGVASMVRDVTQQRAFERQLCESQKMDAIAQLAAGVVHDFNNYLQSICGHITLSRMKLGPGSLAEKSLVTAEAAAGKATGLVKRLITLTRNTRLVLTETDLNTSVEEAVRLFGSNLPARVELKLELAGEPIAVMADRTHIEQVLINLLANARDAIDGSGTITVRTLTSRPIANFRSGSSNGPYVGITVSDTGRGMDHETRARIFDPFFSSKPGRGRGLGLTSVRAIVEGYGGVIEVESEAGTGSTLSVWLPAIQEPTFELRPSAAGERPKRVLVADDSESIVALVQEILSTKGYEVVTAADGDEALRALESDPHLDLVLADVSMPGKSGPDLLRALRARKITMPLILSSGHADERLLDDPTLSEADGFLSKPYRPDALLMLVHRVLENRRRGGPELVQPDQP